MATSTETARPTLFVVHTSLQVSGLRIERRMVIQSEDSRLDVTSRLKKPSLVTKVYRAKRAPIQIIPLPLYMTLTMADGRTYRFIGF